MKGPIIHLVGPISVVSGADVSAAIATASMRASMRQPLPPALTDEEIAACVDEARTERKRRTRNESLGIAAVVALALAVLALIFLAGCGASAVRVNAEAADTLGRALDVAGDQVVTHRNADVLAAAHTGSTPAEATAAIEAAAAHWAAVVAAEETAAAAQRAYADAVVELAAERTTEAHVLGLLVALARTYQSLAAALEPVGVHLPALPAWAAHALDAGGSP